MARMMLLLVEGSFVCHFDVTTVILASTLFLINCHRRCQQVLFDSFLHVVVV
jgi:hypothetical protein